MNVPEPILKVTVPVYVPAATCAFRFEAETVTLLDAPELSVPDAVLTNNQLPPLLVCATPDQEPAGPQLVIDTVCDAGSLTFATPLKFKVAGLPEMQPPCTVNVTGKDCAVLSG